MNIETIKSSRLGDTYYQINHDSGLTVLVYPKEFCNTTYAVFGTKYGSIDNLFRRSDEENEQKVPEGIAHFLEHKLFENEDCDAFARFAKTGASANAYTSFDTTCYLFSATNHVKESLEILLDFVQAPYFTKETVEKEQGIIGQEIKMYDDDPNWRVFFNLLGALYENHSVKDDIAGTVETISHITPELLYRCYETFYNLNNMALCVSGNITVDDVVALVDKQCKKAPSVQVTRLFKPEPTAIVKKRIEQEFSVSVPLFQLGFKEVVTGERQTVQELAQMEVLLETLAADFTPLFRGLMDAELVNESSFNYEYFEGPGFASAIFGGESKDPEAVAAFIQNHIQKVRENGIDEADFERAKKSIYGRIVSSLNSTDNISNALISLRFANRELFSYIDALADVSLTDVTNCLAHSLQEARAALSIVKPIKK